MLFLRSRETVFRRGKSFFKCYMYFRLPRQINRKINSKLFHATASPNGKRNSRREYFISTQPRIRYVATRICVERAWKKKLSLKRQADYREQDRFPVSLCRLLLPTTLFSHNPSLLLAHLDIHKRRNKKPWRTLFAIPLNPFHSPICCPFAHVWRPQ